MDEKTYREYMESNIELIESEASDYTLFAKETFKTLEFKLPEIYNDGLVELLSSLNMERINTFYFYAKEGLDAIEFLLDDIRTWHGFENIYNEYMIPLKEKIESYKAEVNELYEQSKNKLEKEINEKKEGLRGNDRGKSTRNRRDLF